MTRQDSENNGINMESDHSIFSDCTALNGWEIPFWVLISGGKTEKESTVIGGKVSDSTPFCCQIDRKSVV